MDELLKQLNETRLALKAFVGRDELNDEEVEKLEALNKKAVKLQAQITAQEQLVSAEADNAARIEREKNEAVAEAVKAEQAKSRRLQYVDAPYQSKYNDTSKYDNLDVVETALVIDTLNTQNKPVSGGAFKALALKIGEMKESEDKEERKSQNYIRNSFKAAVSHGVSMNEIEAAVKAATDPMYTGGSGIGSDWVGTAYSSELWRSIRAANPVLNRVPSDVIPDGFSSKYWPVESTDPTWYKVAEATASDSTLKVPAATVTASQAATANKQLTVGKLGARVLYTGEMGEDSLIAFAPQLREQLMISGAEILEHVAVDGDVETSANKNINDIAGTPAATDVFLLLDGFRKLALVTNTANARSAAGGFVIKDFSDTLKLMGTAGLAGADPSKVGFIVDFNTHWAALNLPEALTKDVHTAATFENGFLKRAYGYEIMPSFQMHRTSADRKANTSGKIDLDTTANNTTGSILAVRFDQWKQAYKRRMTMETTRIANADSWEIVALVRWGMAYRDNEASAITYNVGV
jgi:hypothetical protein